MHRIRRVMLTHHFAEAFCCLNKQFLSSVFKLHHQTKHLQDQQHESCTRIQIDVRMAVHLLYRGVTTLLREIRQAAIPDRLRLPIISSPLHLLAFDQIQSQVIFRKFLIHLKTKLRSEKRTSKDVGTLRQQLQIDPHSPQWT